MRRGQRPCTLPDSHPHALGPPKKRELHFFSKSLTDILGKDSGDLGWGHCLPWVSRCSQQGKVTLWTLSGSKGWLEEDIRSVEYRPGCPAKLPDSANKNTRCLFNLNFPGNIRGISNKKHYLVFVWNSDSPGHPTGNLPTLWPKKLMWAIQVPHVESTTSCLRLWRGTEFVLEKSIVHAQRFPLSLFSTMCWDSFLPRWESDCFLCRARGYSFYQPHGFLGGT